MEPPITSLQNPAVKQVVKLRTSRQRRESARFVAEGAREVGRALACGLMASDLYVCPELLDDHALQLINGQPTREVTEAVMKKMAYHQRPEGLIGVFQTPEATPLADLLESASTCDDASQPGGMAAPAVFLVAVGTEKPGNLGAMARTAWALGAAGLVAAGTPVDRWNPNAIRSSTGAVFCLPMAEATESDAIETFEAAGARLVVSTPDGGEPLSPDFALDLSPGVKKDRRDLLALVVGPEDTGLGAHWLQAAHRRVRIPMRDGPVDSLNASVAAGLLLWAGLGRR